MSSTDGPTSHRVAGAVGVLVAALPVPALAPAAGGGIATALVTDTRRRNAAFGAAVGLVGGVGYLLGWVVLAFALDGVFPPVLPDGGPFAGFAGFLLVLDVTGGAVGGLLGGALARRARERGDGSTDESQ